MTFGHISPVIDLPQVLFWLFFLAFLALVFYLRRADKREGYPMKASPFDPSPLLGFPLPPEEPQTYVLNDGGTTLAPHFYAPGDVHARPLRLFDGTPLVPVGNPLLAGLGPGAWVKRRDEPMLTEEGELNLQPLRLLPDWSIPRGEADPRGMRVFDFRWNLIGTVRDVWIDRSIKIPRLLEVEPRPGLGRPVVLVPIWHVHVLERAREVHVESLHARQLADVPMPAAPDRITAQEDERLNAYFAAGRFYRDAWLPAAPPSPCP